LMACHQGITPSRLGIHALAFRRQKSACLPVRQQAQISCSPTPS